MIDYGQFCTVARGAEVLGELWTPLVVRELLCGSRRFNDIRRGVPRMSATLADPAPAQARGDGRGRAASAAKGGWEYHLTPGGRGAAPDRGRPRATGARAGSAAGSSASSSTPASSCGTSAASRSSTSSRRARVVIHFRFTDAPTRRAPVVAGGGEPDRGPVPRRSGPRADGRRRVHRARADGNLDRRQRARTGRSAPGTCACSAPAATARRCGVARPQHVRADARRRPRVMRIRLDALHLARAPALPPGAAPHSTFAPVSRTTFAHFATSA